MIAFVQNQEGLVGPSAADYPTQHGIPVVNTEGGGNYPYDSPMYFPTTSSGDQLAFAMIAGLAKVAVPAGKVKLGMLTCAEASQCRNFDRTWSSDRAAGANDQRPIRARPADLAGQVRGGLRTAGHRLRRRAAAPTRMSTPPSPSVTASTMSRTDWSPVS